ncbi:MAG TPA: type II secretion system secretin GspD [Rhizomicrobium sp.]|nr:type II secretion system secretin GspD [Rhizomicrobium sp.]
MKRTLLLTLALSFLPQAAALAQTAASPAGQVLNLQDADIRAFIQDVGRATGYTFIIDPRVQGKVTISSQQPLQQAELMDVLFSALRANGLVAIPTSSGAYRIALEEGAAQSAAAAGARLGDGFSTQVFRLHTLDARSAAEALKPLIGRQGVVVPSNRGNLLIVADYNDNLRRIRNLLGEIDQTGGITEAVSLRASSAREIAEVLDALLKAPGADAQLRNGLVSIVVVESSNTLILRGEGEAVRPLLPIIEDLDRRAESAGDVRVVRLQFADAQQLVPVLQQLVGQSVTPAPQSAATQRTQSERPALGRGGAEPPAPEPASAPATPRGEQRASITRYPGTNAIVIAAPPETQTMLAEVIRKLDVRREQVLVEAIVVEVSDATAKRLGVQFAIAGRNSSGAPLIATNFSNARPNLPAILGAAAAPSAIPEGSTLQNLRDAAAASIMGATGMIGGGIGSLNGDTLFGFIINAVKSDNTSNLLSTPSILTLDNQDATILVGQNVPITTGEVLGTANVNPFRTIQRQDVGIQLDVRPQINAGGTVTLFLRQEVSSVAGPVSNVSPELVLNRREVETTVNVDNGEIIVLGGLLDQKESATAERTPILGDVPVLGSLFRSTTRTRERTNLMIFIRPTILRSADDARRATAPKYEYVIGQQRAAEPSRQAQLEALVQQYLRAEPPRMPAVPPAPPVQP